MSKRSLVILGATGSIGTQALDVVRQHPDLFEVYALTAHNNIEKLMELAREFQPQAVVIANEEKFDALRDGLADCPITVYAGADALCQIVEAGPVDMVLAAMVGFSGLLPTIHAIKARKAIALANKETLVVAGELITSLAREYKVPILPVDSEHSAIFQCLAGEYDNDIEKLILTASGGPFRGYDEARLAAVTPAQALQHPNWEMGAKITIDSATMMNKGFEVMEARWLFGVEPDRIEVVVHPESVIHSAVQFADGSIKAQLGMPDMRIPIQYAFSYPGRLSLNCPRLDLFALQTMHFERPDSRTFRCLAAAYEAIRRGGNMPCICNAANEVANSAFRSGRIGFLQIADVIERMMQEVSYEAAPTLDNYLQTDAETRRRSEALIASL